MSRAVLVETTSILKETRDKAEVCRLVPRGLDVSLALMAAGLAEGRTEEGERGGGEPEKRREEAPTRPEHRRTKKKKKSHRQQQQRGP